MTVEGETPEGDLLTIDEIARMTDAPAKFVLHTLDRAGIKPVAPTTGGWTERHKVPNLRWHRSDIEAWIAQQG